MPTTTSSKPPALQELLSIFESGRSTEAASLVRRQTRCTPQEAQKFLVALTSESLDVVRNHGDMVALLLGEPAPSLLERFAPQRTTLLRLVRRGRRLEALGLVRAAGDVGMYQAREFCEALKLHGHRWEDLAEDYAYPPKSFWQRRPAPAPPPESEGSGMVVAPDIFDPRLLAEWLKTGQYRAGVLWVRRMTAAPREECQALIDRLEELLFDHHPDPWSMLALEKPALVAALAELPDPEWLRRLAPKRTELLDLLAANRNLAAIDLVSQTFQCGSVEARRFLRVLNQGKAWDSTLQLFGALFAWPERPAPLGPTMVELQAMLLPAPAPVAAPPAVTAPALAPPLPAPPFIPGGKGQSDHTLLFGPCPAEQGAGSAVHGLGAMPWDSSADSATTASSAAAPGAAHAMPWDSAADSATTASSAAGPSAAHAMPWDSAARDSRNTASTALPWDSARDSQSTASSDVPWDSAQDGKNTAAGYSAPITTASTPLRLDDSERLMEHLRQFADACKRKDMPRAERLFSELETAGFNARWVSGHFPALRPMLPPEPWHDDLPALAVVAETVSGIADGSIDPVKLARQHGAKALQSANLENIVSALETAWKTKQKGDLEVAVGLVKEHPQLEKEINQRVPWLTDLLDMDHDGTSDVLEIANDPGAYFGDLLRTKHPDLLQRLGEARVKKVQDALPELLAALKERNMRGVMRTMTRLRLGPSDVKSLLSVLKVLMDKR